MGSFRAVAVFPHIDPSNFEQFCALATQMMQVIQKQESILRYDMFFSDNNTRCTVLEEFATPEGVFEHVKANADLLEQLTALGGKIEGSIFPIDQAGVAINEIRSNWDSKFHNHFLGKN
jgi:quinol monooxygenase YgiN